MSRRPTMADVDYYDLLGVQANASAEEIEDAWKQQMKVHHPDRGGDEETSKLLNAAHDALTDPQQRADYDDSRRGGGPSVSPGPGGGVGEDVWGDWDDFATSASAGATTWVDPPSTTAPDTEGGPASATSPRRAPRARRGMRGWERAASFLVNALLLAAVGLLAGWLVSLVSAQTSDLTELDGSADGTAILASLVVPGVFVLLALGGHGLGALSRWRRHRRSPFAAVVRPNGATFGLVIALALVGAVAVVSAPGLLRGEGFGSVEAQVAQSRVIAAAEEAAREASADGLTGLPIGPVACTLGRNDRGWPLPDPACTPGRVGTSAKADLCAGTYRPQRPSGPTINTAQAEVAASYSTAGSSVDPESVVFLIPIRLGGAWDVANLWPRGALVKRATVDAVLAKLCAKGSGLTVEQVQDAARANDLASVLR